MPEIRTDEDGNQILVTTPGEKTKPGKKSKGAANGVEKDPGYFEIAKNRIEGAINNGNKTIL